MTTETGQPMFRCEVCGRRHAWSAERAGQRIRCACGEEATVPAEAESDLYDLAPTDVDQPKKVVPIAMERPEPVVPYRRAVAMEPVPGEAYSEANPLIVSVWKDLVIPIALIVIGSAAEFAWAYHSDPAYAKGAASLGRAASSVGFHFTIDVILMFVGVIIAARVLGASFGNVPTAILKLGAIAVSPSAVGALLMLALGSGYAPLLVGWVFGLGIYFLLFWLLFDLDAQEAWNTVLICFILRLFFTIVWIFVPV